MTEPTLQERLREYAGWAHYDRLRDLLVEAADALDAAQADVEKLREALLAQKAADDASMTGPNDKGYDHWQELENKAKELATAALGRTL